MEYRMCPECHGNGILNDGDNYYTCPNCCGDGGFEVYVNDSMNTTEPVNLRYVEDDDDAA
jgi:DnaJ-class molecular chaperone